MYPVDGLQKTVAETYILTDRREDGAKEPLIISSNSFYEASSVARDGNAE